MTETRKPVPRKPVRQPVRHKPLSRRFENPTFELERDQENNAILIGDIRRIMSGGLVIVVAFSIVLMVGATVEAGLNLLMIVAVPLAGILAFGEFTAWLLHRRDVGRGPAGRGDEVRHLEERGPSRFDEW